MRNLHHLTMRLFAAAGLAVCGAAQADDYRFEAGAGISRFSAAGEHADIWNLRGTYYFENVQTDLLPLAEAAYLGRHSLINLSPTRYGSDIGDFDQWRIGTEVYVPNTPLFLSAGATRYETLRTSFDGETVVTGERGHETTWDAAIGLTPFDGLRISTAFGEDRYDPNVEVKYVGKLGDSRFYGFGIRAIDPDDGDLGYSLSADYFLDRTLKLGAEYYESGDRWTLNAEKFFTEKASLGVAYFDDQLSHGLRLQGAWRF